MYEGKPGRPAKPAHRQQHGLQKTYQWHRLRGEDACEPCLRAHREYMSSKRAWRKKQRAVLREIMGGGDNLGPKISEDERREIIASLKKDLDL